MSTRSFIGTRNSDGTITGIYCHSDGYLEWTGAKLAEHYTDPAKVAALMELGDLSQIGAELGERHDFNNHGGHYETGTGWIVDPRTSDWCLSYGRDRGEKDTEAGTFLTMQEFMEYARNSDAEYVYLFDGKSWQVAKDWTGDAWLDLRTALGIPDPVTTSETSTVYTPAQECTATVAPVTPSDSTMLRALDLAVENLVNHRLDVCPVCLSRVGIYGHDNDCELLAYMRLKA